MAENDSPAGADAFLESVALMARLRAPGGCPWDRVQTLDTIRKYTLEELYEVIDAIDRENWEDLREELGDLLLQVLFYAQIAQDEGRFSIFDVLATLNRKLIRRHPHVFGEAAAAAAGNQAELDHVAAANPAEVLRNWDSIKRAEKKASQSGLLDSVPRTFPALLEAAKLGSRAAKVRFDWPDVTGVVKKLREEMTELEKEVDAMVPASSERTRIEEELGDLLFTAANLARHLKIDAEVALRAANAKFRRRFAAMENAATAPLDSMSPSQLEILWTSVKAEENER
jgi:MazG family protein